MDRARKVRKTLPVSPCDIRGLEAWLEEQANAGLFPVSIGSWAVFTTDGVPGTRFRLEPYDRGRTAPTEEQQELYRRAGWSYALNVAPAGCWLFYTADPAAVELSRHNAQLAEVDDVVKFEVADATRFHWGGLRGRVVTNPPYGERLMEKKEAEELYRGFGKAMAKLPDGWQIAVLSSHAEFERAFGRPADKKRKLYNGMLKCDLFMYGKF